jgi:periplasmic copper chaperone A
MQRRTLLATALVAPMAAQAQHAPAATQHGPLRIETPWTRAALEGRQGAGFLTIRNTGAVADRLVAAASPVAGRMELHTHIRDGDVMRMRPVEDIPVPAGGSVSLQPGGLHLMFMGLNRPLVAGETIPVTLRFAQAGEVTIQLAVQAAGARGPGGHGHGHRH